ncbi:phosphonate metabolism transcriptional regulator PhnF [Pseudochelatococcus sp. B33]
MTLSDDDAAQMAHPSPLYRGEGVAAWRQIADEIEADIATQRFGPGEQLPTEARLAARFGVNRHTVRRAIAALAERGLIKAAQGRGTFVENWPLSYPIGPRTRFSENVARERHQPGGELLRAEEIPATPAIARALAIAVDAPVAAVSTRRFADGTPVSCGTLYLPLPRFAGFADAYRRHNAVTPALAACGVDDYRRLETRIAARPATGEEAALLNLAAGRVVLAVTSVNVDRDRRPIEFGQAVFSADRVELLVTSDTPDVEP